MHQHSNRLMLNEFDKPLKTGPSAGESVHARDRNKWPRPTRPNKGSKAYIDMNRYGPLSHETHERGCPREGLGYVEAPFKGVSKEKFFQLLRHPSIAIPPAQGACCLTYRGPDRTYFPCPNSNCLFISMMQYVQKPGLCDINGLVRGINRSNPRTVPTPVRTATHPPQVLFYIRAAKSNQKKGRKKQPLVHQLFAC